MGNSFWKTGAHTYTAPTRSSRQSSYSHQKSASAPTSPADALALAAAEEFEKKFAAFNIDDKIIKETIRREQESLVRPDGGTFSRHDFPTFDPNAPRGGSQSGGPPKTRLEQYDEQVAQQQGSDDGLLTTRSDPALLVQRIVDLEFELESMRQVAEKYKAESDHWRSMFQAASTRIDPSAHGGFSSFTSEADMLKQQLEAESQARLLAEVKLRNATSSGQSFGTRGPSPLLRSTTSASSRFSPNRGSPLGHGVAQKGYFGSDNAFTQ